MTQPIQPLGFELILIHPSAIPGSVPVIAQAAGSGTTGGPAGGATTTVPGAPADGAPVSGGGSPNILFFGIIMMIGMFLIMSMSGRKEKKKRATMLSTLGKRDKIRTAGGIIGTVIELKDNEVLIETDKSSHTRLWLAKGSISTVLDSVSQPSDLSQSGSDTEALSV